MTPIRLRLRPSSTFCPLEPLLLSLAAITDRNDCNERCHVDFHCTSEIPLSPLFASLCLHLHLRPKQWTLQSRFYTTFNIDTMTIAIEPWPLASLPHPLSSSTISSFFTKTQFPPCYTHGLLLDSFPVGLHLRNGHSSWRSPRQDVVHYDLKNVITYKYVTGLRSDKVLSLATATQNIQKYEVTQT